MAWPWRRFADMTMIPMGYNVAFEVLPAVAGVGCPILAASIKVRTERNGGTAARG